MPCYLFTYHAYGSSLPDRKRGYVKRKQGILSSDNHMAELYREAMREKAVIFSATIQRILVTAVLDSREKQEFEVYFVSAEVSHVHILMGWRDNRRWLRMRSSIKSSLSRRMNQECGKREWFVEGGSRKRVKDEKHFQHLTSKYLPLHTGLKWSPGRGYFR